MLECGWLIMYNFGRLELWMVTRLDGYTVCVTAHMCAWCVLLQADQAQAITEALPSNATREEVALATAKTAVVYQ